MEARTPAPLDGLELGKDWIDNGTLALTRHEPPGVVGIEDHAAKRGDWLKFGIGSCDINDMPVILASNQEAETTVKSTIQRLEFFWPNPKIGPVTEKLERHFKVSPMGSGTRDLALTLLDGYKTILLKLSDALDSVECRKTGEYPCLGDADLAATVPGGSKVVFLCPPFFVETDRLKQAGTWIHELAHTLLGASDDAGYYPRKGKTKAADTPQALKTADCWANFATDDWPP